MIAADGGPAGEMRALAARLREARLTVLERYSARARAGLIGRAAARLLDRDDPARRDAEERVAAEAALSGPMARAVIEGMARDWSGDRLLALLEAELFDPDALERFVRAPGGRLVRAFPPALSLHIGAGTVPGVTTTSLIRALLVGSAAVVKPGRGDRALTELFWRLLGDEAPDLAAMAAVGYWEGGVERAHEDALLGEADAVVVYGGDETVRSVRERLPVTTRLIAYHHRLSVALVGRTALEPDALAATADQAARADALFEHRGCVSPHAIFVEGVSGALAFAAALGDALARTAVALPAVPLSPAEGSAVQQLRGSAELRAAAGQPVALHGAPDGSWTVLLEPAAAIEPCLGRTVRVHPVASLGEVPERLAPVGRHLQTVGVAGVEGRRLDALAGALGEVGALRICPLADVAFPPPWWHHDGQGPLTSLLRWVDLEKER